MEQNNQQVSQKPPLPIKTKIAAWIMIIFGILTILGSLYSLLLLFIYTEGVSYGVRTWVSDAFLSFFDFLSKLFPILSYSITWSFLRIILFFIYALVFFILVPISILKRRKMAQKFAIIGILLSLPSLFYGFYAKYYRNNIPPISLGDFLYPSILLILLLLDRKNFWKIAS